MSEFIVACGNSASCSSFKFTNGKHYEVINWIHPSCAEVMDDKGRICMVGVERATLRLAGNGQFRRVNKEEHAELGGNKMIQEYWDKQDKMAKAGEEAMRLALEASHLAERIRVREAVEEGVRKGLGWKIGNVQSTNYHENEYVQVLEKLREILRVPDGENILTHAKVVRVLADALIGLQK